MPKHYQKSDQLAKKRAVKFWEQSFSVLWTLPSVKQLCLQQVIKLSFTWPVLLIFAGTTGSPFFQVVIRWDSWKKWFLMLSSWLLSMNLSLGLLLTLKSHLSSERSTTGIRYFTAHPVQKSLKETATQLSLLAEMEI